MIKITEHLVLRNRADESSAVWAEIGVDIAPPSELNAEARPWRRWQGKPHCRLSVFHFPRRDTLYRPVYYLPTMNYYSLTFRRAWKTAHEVIWDVYDYLLEHPEDWPEEI